MASACFWPPTNAAPGGRIPLVADGDSGLEAVVVLENRGRMYFRPSGKLELYSESLAAAGADPLPGWQPELESPEARPDLFGRYPLKLLTPKEQHFLGSSFANLPTFRRLAGEPAIELHPDDATARGIVDGSWVDVFNDRGSCRLRARVRGSVQPGVAISEVVHWQLHGPDGRNVNWTTPDYLTDLGANSSYHTNLVEVRAHPPRSERPSAEPESSRPASAS